MFGFPEGFFGFLKTFGKTKTKKTYPRVGLKPSNVTVLQTQRYMSTDRDHGRERLLLFGGHDGTTRDP